MSTRCGVSCKHFAEVPRATASSRRARAPTSSSSESATPDGAPAARSTASSKNHASLQREPVVSTSLREDVVKSSGSSEPNGQFSSDLRGCRRRSTSSSSATPHRNKPYAWTKCSASRSRPSFCFSSLFSRSEAAPVSESIKEVPALALTLARFAASAASCSISVNFKTKAFTSDGAATTIPPTSRANRRRSTRSASTVVVLEKLKVKTGLSATGEENVVLKTARVISTRGRGLTEVSSFSPSAMQSASSGATTVVFPWPISIW
mmetsp:Transcript_17786/g.61499  ORF Transcript_17786/g.61499 Transcript_17786/m.61499 type:complete len:264 (-) Transcript_17786:1692-2483(-)